MAIACIVIALSVTILIHEFCHLLILKKNGFKIDKFSLGIPLKFLPRLRIWRDKDGTDYVISPLLIGGAVTMAHEEGGRIERSSLWVKTQIYLSGMLGNVLLASVILSILFFLKLSAKIDILPSIFWSIFYGFGNSFYFWICGLPISVGLILTGKVAASGVVVGPIGIIQMMHSSFFTGLFHFLGIIASVNIGLAVVNLLPFSPLDGGKLFAAILERFFPKRKKFIYVFQVIGFVLVILLIIFVFTQDIRNLF